MPAIRVIDLYQQHIKAPALLFNYEVSSTGKKIPRDLPKGWKDLEYEQTVEMNKTRSGNALAVNLEYSDYMVVDIDSKDALEEARKSYQSCWETKSLVRKLPHMLFRKHDDDKRTKNDIDRDGNKIDYIYDQTWEDPFAMVNYSPHTVPDVFTDFQPPSPKSPAKKAFDKQKMNEGKEKEEHYTEFHKRILDNIDVRYWVKYDTWRALVFAMKDEGIPEEKMIAFSQKGGDSYTDGCVQNLLKDWDAEKSPGWGTCEHHSQLSNPEMHAAITVNRSILAKPKEEGGSTRVKLELDDLSLAKAFLTLEKDNVVFAAKNIYLFRDGEWREDVKGNYRLKNYISDTLVKEVLTAQGLHTTEMLKADAAKRKAMDEKKDFLNKIYQRVCSSSGIDKICSTVKAKVVSTKKDIVFDTNDEQLYNLHFRNGVLELKTQNFRERVQLDYVTQYLDWDYEPTINESKLAWVREMYRKIQPDPEQRKFMLAFLAYCLTGDTTRTVFKMNIGYSAGNGKSTEFKIHESTFPIYSHKVGKDTFQLNNTKRHKSMHRVIVNPIRFLYVEELSEKKMDIDYVKDLVDGANVECEILYGTTITKPVQCKLNTCSNKDFSGSVDGGILRRGLVQHYTSDFRELGEIHLGVATTEEWFDDTIHHYKKDTKAPERFADDDYKNAYLALLLEHFDLDFTIPTHNREAFQEILQESDELQLLLDEKYVKTGVECDRVNRDDLMDHFFGTKRHCSKPEFNTMMRSRGYTWSKTKRLNGVKGCFVGLRLKDSEDSEGSEDEG